MSSPLEEPTTVHRSRCAVWSSDAPCDCDGWRDLAACASLPSEVADRIFFPRTGAGYSPTTALATALQVCAGCPVRRDCTALADATEIGTLGREPNMSGVYGGETVKARLRRRAGV